MLHLTTTSSQQHILHHLPLPALNILTMKSSLCLTSLSAALAAALPTPAIPYPSSLLFPTTFSTSVLPAPSAGGGAGIIVDNMAPGGGGLPPGGMGGDIGKRGKLDTDLDSTVNNVYTSGKYGSDKSKDGEKGGGNWMDKGFAGDMFKGDKDKDDDEKSKDKDDKSSGDSTFDNNRPDNKDDKSSTDKSIPDVPASNDKPAASDKSTPEINNSNTFFDPAAEKEAEELALTLDAANDN
jgi:hypothetical protein